MPVTRDNHYVPVWYQSRFLLPNQTQYFYLDQQPRRVDLPGGKVKEWHECRPMSPSQCFYQTDLYTTFFGVPNDEIERFLFGKIDDEGAKGLTAILDHDMWGVSRYFGSFFEYVDAQKLRTPKGLDWLKSNYPRLSQIDLMQEMQAVRYMHCPMWSEGVREILSAVDSEIKFIVTDHPVTIYNPACPPESGPSQYPHDPPIALKGTQTVFPLDLNHCLIFTNLEFARNPHGTNPLETRTNARSRGSTPIYFGDPIAKRKIGGDEVRAINYLLKSRSKRYLASAKKEWLAPPAVRWKEIGNILLPPDGVWCHFGGDISVGYKDGSSQHWDGFGRSEGVLPHLIKVPANENQGPVLYDVRERNMMFFDRVLNILGLDQGKTWLDVRKELTNDQVKQIHTAYAALWPIDTNLVEMLPKPASNVFRAVYMGLVDPRTASKSIMGFLPYADEIVVINPFPNAGCIRPEHSPLQVPNQYKLETLKNIFFLIEMAPFIEAGIVHLIPDPFELNAAFREEVFEMASQRLKGWQTDGKFWEEMKPISKADHRREMYSMPDAFIKKMIKRGAPELTDDQVEGTLQYIKKQQLLDPLCLLQSEAPNEKVAFLRRMCFSPNLEVGLFLAQVTGSFIYTDSYRRWTELIDSAKKSSAGNNHSHVAPLVELLGRLPFTVEAHAEIQLEARRAKRFEGVRKTLQSIWKFSQLEEDFDRIIELREEIAARLKQEVMKAQAEWSAIHKDFLLNAKIPPSAPLLTFDAKLDCAMFANGLGQNTIHRLLVTYGGLNYSRSLPMALFVKANVRNPN